jgi:Xaa-Pro aminopeptidase
LKFLGHGIGQTIHEEPYITETRNVILEPNITCTMEPLYMIPGRMGFHVEDMYRITPGGFAEMTGTITPNDELIRIG